MMKPAFVNFDKMFPSDKKRRELKRENKCNNPLTLNSYMLRYFINPNINL